MTMAMQRASPMRISPAMYSGWSGRKTMASTNISTGPMTQFCSSDSHSTRVSRHTAGRSS